MTSVTAFAPATVSNVACGFDVLGFALDEPGDEVTATFAGNGGVTERAIQLIALLTVLSIAPSILIMMTSFTRIVVVLSLLRTALGTDRKSVV